MNKTQIFFLPFAGGNKYSFHFLEKYLPKDLEIFSLELPGRGKRMYENCLTDLPLAVEDYYQQVQEKRSTAPYIIYGHSMGALMGLFVTQKLETIDDPPLKLIVSGNAGPKIGFTKKRYNLPGGEFKNELRKLGGISDEVIENEEIFGFFSPIIRADLEVLERSPLPDIKIKTGIHAIMGSEEKYTQDIEEWNKHTSGSVKCEHMKGDHFFIHHHAQSIVKRIERYCDTALVL